MPPTQLLQRISQAIDPQSTVPLKAQLKGFFVYGISSGVLASGENLPSVRVLAKALKLSPVTISQLYADLSKEGLIVTRVGSGTFVAELEEQRSCDTGGFAARVQDLVAFGHGIGLSDEAMRVALLEALAPNPHEKIVLVAGIFAAATAQYATEIQSILPPYYRAMPIMIEDLDAQTQADLILTPHNFLTTVQSRAPHCPISGFKMLASEATRVEIARLPPHSALLAVSYFAEFLPSFRENLKHYGPHLGQIEGILSSDPALADKLASHRGPIVYSTGAQDILSELPPSSHAFEYRHSPDLNRLALALEAAFPLLQPLQRTPV